MVVALILVLGLGLLVAGAELVVRGASRVATLLGVTPMVTGPAVVSVGTSAPELAVGIVAGVQGKGELAVGNIAGTKRQGRQDSRSEDGARWPPGCHDREGDDRRELHQRRLHPHQDDGQVRQGRPSLGIRLAFDGVDATGVRDRKRGLFARLE